MKTWLFFAATLFAVPASAQVLFPGDANNDGRADMLDLLPIGLAYGSIFEPRPDPSTDWSPHFFIPWPPVLPVTGVNFGFADTDGSGRIDSLDVDAIALNYDSLQTGSQPPPQPYLLPDTLTVLQLPQISVFFSDDTVNVNDTFYAIVQFTVQPSSFPGALAAALRLHYDPTNIRDSLVRILFDTLSPDLMAVGAATQFAGFDRALDAGTMELAVSGRGQNALSVSRPLGAIEIVVEDVIIRNKMEVGDTPFWFEFETVVLINTDEQVFKVQTHSDTIVLRQPGSSAPELAGAEAAIRVFPNPACDRITVETGAATELTGLRLYDARGRLLRTLAADGHRATLPTGDLPRGLYRLETQSRNGAVWRHTVALR